MTARAASWSMFVAMLASCVPDDPPPPPPPEPFPEPSECLYDLECNEGRVCARDKSCVDAGKIRTLAVRWSIEGQAASPTRCEAYPALYIRFTATYLDDGFGYSPVPCYAGQYSMDKLPQWYTRVELGRSNRDGGESLSFGTLTVTDAPSVQFDLPLTPQ